MCGRIVTVPSAASYTGDVPFGLVRSPCPAAEPESGRTFPRSAVLCPQPPGSAVSGADGRGELRRILAGMAADAAGLLRDAAAGPRPAPASLLAARARGVAAEEERVDEAACLLLSQTDSRDPAGIRGVAVAGVKAAHDLERIAARAAGLARVAEDGGRDAAGLPPVRRLAELLAARVEGSLDGADGDDLAATARLLHAELLRAAVEGTMADPRRIARGMALLAIGRELAGIADLADSVVEETAALREG